jgi:hypothetical protein
MRPHCYVKKCLTTWRPDIRVVSSIQKGTQRTGVAGIDGIDGIDGGEWIAFWWADGNLPAFGMLR